MQNVLDQLTDAVKGLEYPSESDAPFTPFHWPASATSARAQLAAQLKTDRGIEEVPVSDFFDALKDTNDTARFEQLRRMLETSLTDLSVFRFGEVKVDIYLMGRLDAQNWIGLHTTSVET
jgi:hypothetical protein